MPRAEPTKKCHPWTEELFDRLDAAVFTGDEFFDAAARERFQWFMARWQRGLNEHARHPIGGEE